MSPSQGEGSGSDSRLSLKVDPPSSAVGGLRKGKEAGEVLLSIQLSPSVVLTKEDSRTPLRNSFMTAEINPFKDQSELRMRALREIDSQDLGLAQARHTLGRPLTFLEETAVKHGLHLPSPQSKSKVIFVGCEKPSKRNKGKHK
jgi:hypothetical protein